VLFEQTHYVKKLLLTTFLTTYFHIPCLLSVP